MDFACGERYTDSLSQQSTADCTSNIYDTVSPPFQVKFDEKILNIFYSAVFSTRSRFEKCGICEKDCANGLGWMGLCWLVCKCLRLNYAGVVLQGGSCDVVSAKGMQAMVDTSSTLVL